MRNIIIQFLIIALSSCANLPGGELKPTALKCELTHINMGQLPAQMPKDTTFFITNTGDSPLLIQNVETSCGCTTPKWTKEPIKSGKSGEITVTYDAKYPGRFHKTISVFANVPNSPIELSIAGEVAYEEESYAEVHKEITK